MTAKQLAKLVADFQHERGDLRSKIAKHREMAAEHRRNADHFTTLLEALNADHIAKMECEAARIVKRNNGGQA